MNIRKHIKDRFWRIDDEHFTPMHHKAIRPFENAPTRFSDERVNEAVGYHNRKWHHTELVVKTENATVEPQYAYAVNGLRTIIGASIRTRQHLPSPVPMLGATFVGFRKKTEKAILFDGSMGINYFHLLSDVLHKLYLLENFTRLDCPLLVGRSVWQRPFFQYLICNTSLSSLNWQPVDRPVKAKELWIARPLPYDRTYWQRTKRLFIDEDAALTATRAIFINRTGTRQIINIDEIAQILRNHGVQIVDPGTMNMHEQAALFNTSTHVIGIHGAGMTNVAFCNADKVKVLELCSNNRIGTQYYWLSTALGIPWDMMLGGKARNDQSFTLDPVAFEKRLKQFLS